MALHSQAGSDTPELEANEWFKLALQNYPAVPDKIRIFLQQADARRREGTPHTRRQNPRQNHRGLSHRPGNRSRPRLAPATAPCPVNLSPAAARYPAFLAKHFPAPAPTLAEPALLPEREPDELAWQSRWFAGDFGRDFLTTTGETASHHRLRLVEPRGRP